MRRRLYSMLDRWAARWLMIRMHAAIEGRPKTRRESYAEAHLWAVLNDSSLADIMDQAAEGATTPWWHRQ